ncbi:MAG: NAD(P)-dependent oxidoreductase [Planctomycetota bacterium]|jgi:2-hydroxy-3-oxopropionate reductase
MSKRIGFIGLGNMGKPMAVNLVNAGFPVTVTYNKNQAPADELQSLGATKVATVKEVAAASDVVITVLPADKEMYAVIGEGLLNSLPAGAVCIDMTTSLPKTIIELARRAEDKGIKMLDAPISGGVPKAEAGTLTVMVGGDPTLYEEQKDVLEVMGGTLYYTGAIGSGKAIKMINQFMNASHTYIASEALYLARQLNIDLNSLHEVVTASSGNSWVFQNLGPKSIMPKNFTPGFRLALMKKDIDLAKQSADECDARLPGLEMVEGVYQAILEQGHGDDYYTVISKWIEQHNT